VVILEDMQVTTLFCEVCIVSIFVRHLQIYFSEERYESLVKSGMSL